LKNGLKAENLGLFSIVSIIGFKRQLNPLFFSLFLAHFSAENSGFYC